MERLDLATYSKEIKQNYDKLISGELSYVIYTTQQDSSLKPTVQGDGDINEFVTEFEEGAVQFGYIRVNPYGSDVQKILLLGWCPDSAPLKSKVSFSNNVAEVGRILHYHVQVTARDPDDLDVDDLLKTVSNASGARYSIQSLQQSSAPKTTKPAPKPVPKSAKTEQPAPAKPAIGTPLRPASTPVSAKPAEQDDEWGGEEEIQERDFSKKPLETLPSAYKPTKVDIETLRKGPSQTTSSQPATVSVSLGDGRLSSLPKPKVTNSVASKFQEVVQPSFGSKPSFGAPPKRDEHVSSGLNRNFGATNGKTPAQLWAEKKGQFKDVETDSKPVNAVSEEETNVHVNDIRANLEALKTEDEPKPAFPPPPVRSSFPPPPVRTVPKEEEEKQTEPEQEKKSAPSPPTTPRPAAAASAAPTAVAEYDYEAAEDNEIGFAEGEVIVDIKFVDEDWWLGTNAAGKTGLFPATYVVLNEKKDEEPAAEQVPEPEPEPEPETSKGLTAVAEYDYDATEDNEISFKEQDIITEIEQVDEDWWLGSCNGERGLFPANYVTLQ
ncbi:hypothetical protein KL905_004340 [Ogataea polymorpha]|nr:hypothetical protein KL908_004053 [Ogataea polymorpha]KAG7898021.1 hypothetical protein KL935_004574 [Ogataea polymorpha]KAG7900552.1 hypothetical protein KL907_004670 [Ogataea polymorpha]KAG7917320.1 hypothetical protein KL905_004340 [Ogataea polymorpha]